MGKVPLGSSQSEGNNMRALSIPRSKNVAMFDGSPGSEMQQTTRQRVLAEAEVLLTAQMKCKDLWNALKVADYKKTGVLNEAAVVVLYEKEREKFQELLLVNSSEELVSLLDEFEDGFLTVDEQVLIFSLVKERMQTAAEALCDVHEYEKYKEMMKAIRMLEADIVTYQETLRKQTHERELVAYRELGEDKMTRFQEEWKRRFDLFAQESERRATALRSKQAREMQECLESSMKRERKVFTARPSARIKTLQMEERLVAVNERFNEAQKIRRELRTLEQEDQIRIVHVLQTDLSKRKASLSARHRSEQRQLHQKLQTAYNRLAIERDQQLSRLEKEIKLHFNDITKNQNLSKKLARKKGESRDELRRTKKKAKGRWRRIMRNLER